MLLFPSFLLLSRILPLVLPASLWIRGYLKRGLGVQGRRCSSNGWPFKGSDLHSDSSYRINILEEGVRVKAFGD